MTRWLGCPSPILSIALPSRPPPVPLGRGWPAPRSAVEEHPLLGFALARFVLH